MINQFLTENVIKVQQQVVTWQEAIHLGGDLLLKTDAIEEDYIQAMIDAVHTHGPYIAIAPGIAIAHAAPGEFVNKDAISLVTLKEAVEIGHDRNDPIHLFFVVAAKSNEGHLTFLQELVAVLSDDKSLDILKTGNKEAVLALFQ